MIKKIEKNICLFDGTKINIDLSIPLEGPISVDPKRDEFMTDILSNQIVRGLKKAFESYEKSPMPASFLKGMEYYITNMCPVGFYGASDKGNWIIMDADAASDIKRISSSFVLGHAIGQKILLHRDVREVKKDIANCLMISSDYEEYLSSIFAELCGSIVTDELDLPSISENIEPERIKYMQTLALRNIYRP